jgi:hypothetical protein
MRQDAGARIEPIGTVKRRQVSSPKLLGSG